MKKIRALINSNKNKIVCLMYVLIFSYFFTSTFFDRPMLSIIPNAVLIIMFIAAFSIALLYKINFISKPFIFLYIVFILTSASNLLSGTFSYDFIILILIAFSIIVLAKVDNNIFFNKFIKCMILGFTLGLFLIIITYFSEIFTSLKIPAQNKFMNIDRMASIGSSLFSLSIIEIFNKQKNKFLFLSIFGLVISLIILLLTFRLGSLVSVFITFFILVLYKIKSKHKKLFSILLIGCPALIGTTLLILTFTNAVPRLTISIYQFLNLDVVLDGSFRERTLMLFRDAMLVFMFPFFGGGADFVSNFNLSTSHNFIGDIGLKYGLLLMILFIFILYKLFKKIQKSAPDKLVPYFIYFLSHNVFLLFYGMNFTNRVFYFEFGFVLFYVFNNDEKVGNHPKKEVKKDEIIDYTEIYC